MSIVINFAFILLGGTASHDVDSDAGIYCFVFRDSIHADVHKSAETGSSAFDMNPLAGWITGIWWKSAGSSGIWQNRGI